MIDAHLHKESNTSKLTVDSLSLDPVEMLGFFSFLLLGANYRFRMEKKESSERDELEEKRQKSENVFHSWGLNAELLVDWCQGGDL